MSSASPGQRFADYFAICGLDTVTGLEADQLSGDSLHISPLERSYKAKIIAHFPNCVDWNPFDDDATRMLCLPQGLTFKKQSEPHEPIFHSFLITREDGSRVYGAALTFYEEVQDKQIVAAMQTLQQMHDAELLTIMSDKFLKRSASVPNIPDALIPPDPPPRPACRRSSIVPGNSSNDAFDSTKDILLVAKCICMIVPLPFVSAAKSFLEQLYGAAVNKKESCLPLECYIYNLIFEVPLPPPGRTMRFTCTGENITCQRPGLNELPLFDYSFKELCGLLGVENIVQLFTCILLEYQILIISNNYHRFMLVAESFSTVIFPFVWQHVYVPILPASLVHFLDAPVPFVMGLYCKTDEEKRNLILPSEASLCLVDIDNSSLTTPEELPELPNKQSLINELYDATEKFSVPVPESSQSRFNSNRNSLEIPYNDYLANGDTDYDSTGSNHSSPRDSNSPTLQRKKTMSPRTLRRSCPPVLLAREKPAARVKTQRTNRVPKSKSSTCLDLSNNPRLRAIAAIAERTGIVAPISTVVAGLEKAVSDTELSQYCEDGDVPIMGDPAKEISRQQQHENEFNTAVREIFANWFTQVLREYESFVIQPQQDMDQWISNREEMQNFDKAAFLSDQPNQFLPFLSPFTETQMFASFIDMKIMSTWEEPEPRLAVFDQRVESMKSRLGVVRSPSYEKCNTLKNAIQVLLRRSNSVDHMAIYPHQLVIPIKKEEESTVLFGGLYADILSDSPLSKGGRQPKVNWRKRGRQKQHSEHLLLNTSQDGKKIKDKMATSLKKYMEESKTRTQTSQFGDMALESTQSNFIQRLLKECQQKTKRMLVQKMGQEAVDLGHGDASVSGVEENTLIASLCDLLERVWSHGLLTKEGKSALWSHLLAYQSTHEMEGEEGVLHVDSSRLLPVPSGNAAGPSSPRKNSVRRHSAVPDLFPHSISFQKKPLTALLADMGSVQQMTQIKTDVGHARAWTRLALEKKVLSKHLRKLLSDDEILKQRYKDYAFLRTEDEREQFVYHLLSLTAVDFFCFTNCFASTSIAYKVVIKTGKSLGGGSTSASAWMTLAGELDDTGVINLPKNENEFRFKHSNLGVLTSLRIGHDNTGLSPSWFIEQVIVKNEITGHIYRFPCGRWLSKTSDDGSSERLLVAERLRPRHHEDSKLSDVCRLSPQKKAPVLSRRSSIKTRIPDVQEKLADSVNNIVKFFYKPEKERGNLTYLLCGDGGLCQSLEQVFQCGFKSFSLFRNSFFIWDILEKAHQFLVSEGDDGNRVPEYLRKARKSFCTIITRINNSSHTIGKDGKFQSFVCLGARDHLLHDWLQLISTCPATTNMYDTASFFRDQALMQFLVDVLGALVEFNITLEASLLKGIS